MRASVARRALYSARVESPKRTTNAASALGLVALVAASLFASASADGAEAGACARYAGFLLAHVLVPGWILRAALGVFEGGALTTFFGAWMLGQGLQIALFLGSRVLGCAELYPWLPLLVLPLLALRRVRSARLPAVSPATFGLLVGLCALVVVRNLGFAPDPWGPQPESDPPFHAGNTAELLHHWPLCDPRLAGEPLRYHVFSYACAAGASQVTGLAVWSTAYCLGNALFPLLLAFGLLALGERCLGSRAAGFAAALLVLLHEDLLGLIGGWCGLELHTHSFLSFGVHSSPSSSLALALLAGIVIALHEWSSGARARPVLALVLLALGALESGTKGSSMPVVLAGLGLACLWELARTRRVPRRALAGWALLAAGALPYTLWLVGGPDDYASAMLRVAPLATVRETPLSTALVAAHGPGTWVFVLACALFAVGYLGLALVGCIGRMCEREPRWSALERLLACLGLAGLGATLLVRAPGFSQLFFAYNGQLALACLAGAWIVRRTRWLQVAAALLVIFAAERTTAALLQQRAAQRFTPTALDREHRAGQDWMRRNLPADAVLLVELPQFLHSVHAEREVFYETEKYRARTLASEADGGASASAPAAASDAIAQRATLAGRCLQRPSAANLERARKLVGSARPLVVVRERAAAAEGPLLHAAERPAAGSPLFEPLFENAALGVYRVRGP